MSTLRVAQGRDKTLEEADALRILAAADHGVLATVGADGAPYAVPLSHVLSGDVLYAHSTTTGRKLDNIAHEPRVSYCVVEGASTDASMLSTYYASAIASGPAELVTDDGEKFKALQMLVARYCGVVTAENEAHIARMMPSTGVIRIRIRIEQVSGRSHRPV